MGVRCCAGSDRATGGSGVLGCLLGKSKGPAGGSSDFLGDPPPDPRFLASLGAQSRVELHHSCVVDLFGGQCPRVIPNNIGARNIGARNISAA